MLADWIISYFPPHKGYTEAFGGGGSVLLKKRPSYFEVYNDLDCEIVNVFKMMRDRGPELLSKIELTPFARDEMTLSYKKCDDPIEWARRVIYRSMAGFGSAAATGQSTGFRANANRSGTTPAIDWRNYPGSIPALIERLRGVIIENKDAWDIIKQHDNKGVLHFLDPPYVHSTRKKKGQRMACRHEMTDEQHVQLLTNIKTVKGYVVICGYDNDIYNDMLKDFRRIEKMAMADGARQRTEILWLSPNIPVKQTLLL